MSNDYEDTDRRGSAKSFERRLRDLEDAIQGTNREDGLLAKERSAASAIRLIQKILFGAIGVLLTALLLKTFFNYHG